MLTELRIQNFAIIDRLDLKLGPGLTILTGETGAGKSIILDAVVMLIGGRADTTIIRAEFRCRVRRGDVRPQRVRARGGERSPETRGPARRSRPGDVDARSPPRGTRRRPPQWPDREPVSAQGSWRGAGGYPRAKRTPVPARPARPPGPARPFLGCDIPAGRLSQNLPRPARPAPRT